MQSWFMYMDMCNPDFEMPDVEFMMRIREGKDILVLCKVAMYSLTHLPLVPHICISESGEHWFR